MIRHWCGSISFETYIINGSTTGEIEYICRCVCCKEIIRRKIFSLIDETITTNLYIKTI